MNSTEDEVSDFLGEYGRAQAESAEATASLWTFPAMLIDLYDTPMMFATRPELVEALEPAYSVYERLGLTGVGLLDAEIIVITDSLVRARTRWSFESSAETLTDPVFEYTIRRDDDGPRVCFAVAVDLAEKIETIAGRKGISI